MKHMSFRRILCLFMSILMLLTLFSSQLALAISSTEHDHTDGSSCSDHEDEDVSIRQNHLLTVPGDNTTTSFETMVLSSAAPAGNAPLIFDINIPMGGIVMIGGNKIDGVTKEVQEDNDDDLVFGDQETITPEFGLPPLDKIENENVLKKCSHGQVVGQCFKCTQVIEKDFGVLGEFILDIDVPNCKHELVDTETAEVRRCRLCKAWHFCVFSNKVKCDKDYCDAVKPHEFKCDYSTMACTLCGKTKDNHGQWSYDAIDGEKHRVSQYGTPETSEYHNFITTTYDSAPGVLAGIKKCKNCNIVVITSSTRDTGEVLSKETTSYTINDINTLITELEYYDGVVVKIVLEITDNKAVERYYSDDNLLFALNGDIRQPRGEWIVTVASNEQKESYIAAIKALDSNADPKNDPKAIYSTANDHEVTIGNDQIDVFLSIKSCEYGGYGVNYEQQTVSNIMGFYSFAMSPAVNEIVGDFINVIPKIGPLWDKLWDTIDKLENIDDLKDSKELYDYYNLFAENLYGLEAIDIGDYRSYEFLHTNAFFDITYDVQGVITNANGKQELFKLTDQKTSLFAYDWKGNLGELLQINILNPINAYPDGIVALSPTGTAEKSNKNILSKDYYRALVYEYIGNYNDYENIDNSITCPKCLTGYTVITPTGSGHRWKCSNSNCDFKSVIFNHDSVEKINQSQHTITCRCKNSTEGHVFNSTISKIKGNDAVHMRNCVLCGEVEVNHNYSLVFDNTHHWDKCTDCDFERDYSLRALHVWKYSYKPDSSKHIKTCTDPKCGVRIEEDHEHNKVEEIVGNHVDHKLVCVCGDSYKQGHNWKRNKSDYKFTEDDHYTTCKDCGASSIYTPHIIKKNDRVATKLNDSYHLEACSECNGTVQIPHTYEWQEVGAGHQQKCTECGHAINYSPTHNIDYNYQGSYSTVHTKYCTICEYSVEEKHDNYYNVNNETQHKVNCKCGYSDGPTNHSRKAGIKGTSTSIIHHRIECGVCGFTFLEEHSWETVNGVRRCKYCDKECKNHGNFTFGVSTDYKHTKICGYCDISITEDHSWSIAGTGKCTICQDDCNHDKYSYTYINSGDKQHTKACSNCGRKFEPSNHVWNSLTGKCTAPGCNKQCAHSTYKFVDSNNTQHKKMCTTCDYNMGLLNHNTYATTDGHYLSYNCPCGRSNIYVTHNASTSDGSATKIKDNKSYHYTKCTVCQKQYLIGHTWKYANITSTQHDGICKNCGYTKTVNHSWSAEYYSNGSKTHSKRCRFCEQPHTTSIDHTLTYYNINNSTHSVKCPNCNLNNTNKAHTWELRANSSNHYYACKYCDKVKPNSSESHSYGSWSYKNPNLDYRRCVICQKADSEKTKSHSWGSWSKLDSTYCTRKCSSCKQSENKQHSFGSWGEHNSSQHSKQCSRCKGWKYANHTMDYVSTGSSQHQYKCTTCGWVSSTSSHTWGSSSDYNSSYHKRICTKCGGTKNEAHIYQYGKCSFCGRKS